MLLYKEYVDTTEENKKIKFQISFNRSTHNWSTNQQKKIGYQVTVVPVSISKCSSNNIVMEEFGAFTGFNDCLLEVNRQSSKRLAQAIEILKERKQKYLDHFESIAIKTKL